MQETFTWGGNSWLKVLSINHVETYPRGWAAWEYRLLQNWNEGREGLIFTHKHCSVFWSSRPRMVTIAHPFPVSVRNVHAVLGWTGSQGLAQSSSGCCFYGWHGSQRALLLSGPGRSAKETSPPQGGFLRPSLSFLARWNFLGWEKWHFWEIKVLASCVNGAPGRYIF